MLVTLVLLILFVWPLMLYALFGRIIVSHMQSMEEIGHPLSRQLLDHHLFEVDRHLEGEVNIVVVSPSHRQYQHHYNPLPLYPHDQYNHPSLQTYHQCNTLLIQTYHQCNPLPLQTHHQYNFLFLQTYLHFRLLLLQTHHQPNLLPLQTHHQYNPLPLQTYLHYNLLPLQTHHQCKLTHLLSQIYHQPFRGVGGAYVDLDCYLHHHLYFQLQPHHRQMFIMCHMQYLLQLERSVQKGREYQLHIGSLLVETCEIIYVFLFSTILMFSEYFL